MKTKTRQVEVNIQIPKFSDLQPEPMLIREITKRRGLTDILLVDSTNSSAYVAVTLTIPNNQVGGIKVGNPVVAWFNKGGGSQLLHMVQLSDGRLALQYMGLIEEPTNSLDGKRLEFGVGHAQRKWAREMKNVQ